MADFVYITADLQNDAHDCPAAKPVCTDGDRLATADAWLKANIDPIINSPAFANGLLIITFDEGSNTDLANGGGQVATVLVGEVLYRSFNNRRQVGSYVGFAPSPFCSGAMAREQGISKAGNAKARTTMIELAWLWLRYQPDSALSVWFRQRVGAMKGRIRRITIVALARKLLVALWRYLETGVVPQGARLKA